MALCRRVDWYRAATYHNVCVVRRSPECLKCVMEGKKVIVTSSELVVKMDEIKFECTISPNVDVIDRMKIRKIKFSPKSGMSNFAPA